MIKAIFYDFDGVIKESTQIKTEAFYSLYLPFGEDIAEAAKQHHIAHGGISRYEKFKHYHQTFLNQELNEIQINHLAHQFSDIVLRKVIECPYVSGALESLKELKGQYAQHVVTGTPKKEIDIILKELKITDLFVSVKGSPEDKITLSQQIMDAERLKHDEIVFIGDATTDYKAAKHFDFKFILREHEENELLFKSEDVIKLADLTNLKQTLQTINS